MIENQLWELIEKGEWKKDHNYDRVSDFYKNLLTKEEYLKLDEFVSDKTNELYERFEKDWLGNPGINCGDDSWSDLLADIVGRGEKFYNSITAEKLRKMADNHDYEESFHYCFHAYID